MVNKPIIKFFKKLHYKGFYQSLQRGATQKKENRIFCYHIS
jgi:hypothetical protein